MFRTFILLDTGSIHPEAQNWAARVAANGGTVSDSTLRAVSDFCKETASIRSLFLRLNLFAGNNLNAALVPLYLGEAPGIVYGNTVDTNFNFVAGDYTERGTNGGLIGNGVNKYLNTVFQLSTNPFFISHTFSFSVYIKSGNNPSQMDIGMQNSSLNRLKIASATNSTISALNADSNQSNSGHLNLHTVNRNGTLLEYYRLSALFSSATNTPQTPINRFFIFAVDTNGTPQGYSAKNIASYYIGSSFTQTQVSLFYNALQKFQTALNRQV